MSGQHYLSNNKSSLFSVDDDVDDDAFLRHPPMGKPKYLIQPTTATNNHFLSNSSNDVDDRMQKMVQAKREIEERTIKSSERSLSLLRHSEEVGNATAEELIRQREQLERTEKRLDEINTTLRFSQKHIQGIKSVFGSLKNYLSGKNSESANAVNQSSTGSTSSTEPRNESLIKTSPPPSNSVHPGMRIRGLDDSPERQGSVDAQQIIDSHLDEMMGSIGRLKGLAHGLGNEIDSQNDLVENILMKAEKSDITLQRQTKDIKRLLK